MSLIRSKNPGVNVPHDINIADNLDASFSTSSRAVFGSLYIISVWCDADLWSGKTDQLVSFSVVGPSATSCGTSWEGESCGSFAPYCAEELPIVQVSSVCAGINWLFSGKDEDAESSSDSNEQGSSCVSNDNSEISDAVRSCSSFWMFRVRISSQSYVWLPVSLDSELVLLSVESPSSSSPWLSTLFCVVFLKYSYFTEYEYLPFWIAATGFMILQITSKMHS